MLNFGHRTTKMLVLSGVVKEIRRYGGYDYIKKGFANIDEFNEYVNNTPSEIINNYNVLRIYKLKIFPKKIPDNIRDIEVNGCEFTELPDKYPTSLVSLNITHTKILSGKAHFANIPKLEYLYMINNDISKLSFDNVPNLQLLWCNNNKLTTIPENIPDAVFDLNLNRNEIEELTDNLPSGLTKLEISKNKINKITQNLPIGLKKLYLVDNMICELEDFNQELINLFTLDLSNNNILSIDNFKLPPELTTLHLDHNKIKHIRKKLPKDLEELSLHCNNLEEIPDNLPETLIRLVVSRNNIEKIPETLPDDLEELIVNMNYITELPDKLPKRLYQLLCSGNTISRIPDNLPEFLNILDMSYCDLTTIPETLPPNLYELNVTGNQIKELPNNLPLPIKCLYINDNQITDFPITITRLYLYTYNFAGNELDITNAFVRRWYNRLTNYDEYGNVANIYTDSQNVHNASINEGITNSIEFLCSRNIKPKRKQIITAFLENSKINTTTKNLVSSYLEETNIHMATGYTFADIFLMSYDLIIEKELEDILNEEMLSSECKCFTGRINRYVNIFNGIIDECTFEIADTSIFPALFEHLRIQYSDNKEEIKRELLERRYEEEFVNSWVDALE